MAKSEKCKDCSSYKGICQYCKNDNYYSKPQKTIESVPQLFGAGSSFLLEDDDLDCIASDNYIPEDIIFE